jgi:hypothetical protein
MTAVPFDRQIYWVFPDEMRGWRDDVVRSVVDVTDTMVVFGNFVIYASVGDKRVMGMKPKNAMSGQGRLRNPGTKAIVKAVAAHPRGTIFVFWLEDRSPFCFPWQREAADALNKKYPRLFWLSMNSCIIDDVTGAIGNREIPIPDADAYFDMKVERAWAAKGVRNKRPRLSWRGVTTGEDWADYREAPRWQAVSQLLAVKRSNQTHRSVAEAIDVGFSRRVQNVGKSVVPDEMMASGISHKVLEGDQVQIDLDGNANAWLAFKWKLACGSAVLKRQSRYVQYYYRQLVNGTHVLLYDSMDDLVRMATRLVAAPQSEETLQLMERLAKHSSDFAHTHLTVEAMTRYVEKAVLCAAESTPTDWRIQSDPILSAAPVALSRHTEREPRTSDWGDAYATADQPKVHTDS